MTEIEKLKADMDAKREAYAVAYATWGAAAYAYSAAYRAAALAAAQAEVARLTAEVERLRGAVTTYKRGYGPGDGDSAALAAQAKEQDA